VNQQMGRSRRFLILHGFKNWRPRAHWQWWLAEQLRSRGEQVLYPQLPSSDSPGLDEWSAVLHGELTQMGGDERIVVAHSCAVALWLLAASELSPEERVDRVALVAPPGLAAFVPACRSFLPVGLDPAAVVDSSRQRPIVISSDNDPNCPGGLDEYRAIYTDALGLAHYQIPGAGHLGPDDGYGPWPAMLEWCQGNLGAFGDGTQVGRSAGPFP
jgi:predicted alpha/beta hydrolase family esterase